MRPPSLYNGREVWPPVLSELIEDQQRLKGEKKSIDSNRILLIEKNSKALRDEVEEAD